MTQQSFDRYLEYVINKIKDMLHTKGKQYSDQLATQDRLYNFKEIAKSLNTTPHQVLLTLFSKHYIVIKDWFIHNNIKEDEFEERLFDCINYLIFAFMLYKDKNINEYIAKIVDANEPQVPETYRYDEQTRSLTKITTPPETMYSIDVDVCFEPVHTYYNSSDMKTFLNNLYLFFNRFTIWRKTNNKYSNEDGVYYTCAFTFTSDQLDKLGIDISKDAGVTFARALQFEIRQQFKLPLQYIPVMPINEKGE